MNHQENERTHWHRKAEYWISELGIQYQSEIPFPPYQVDIYIPDCHVAIEIDGPFHMRKHDERRDEELMTIYGLPVIRISSKKGIKREQFRVSLVAGLERWGATAKERKTRI